MVVFRVLFVCLACVFGVFSGEAREVQWQFRPPLGQVDASPAVCDLNGDGHADLVVTTTAGSVVAVDHEGRQIWMRGVQIPISIAPTTVDLIEDEVPEVLVVNQSGQISCLAGRTGDLIWEYSLPGKIAWGMTALAASDLDGDGALEVIAADEGGHVVCLSRSGERQWQYDGDHGHGMCPAVGVLGDDKAPSIVLAGPAAAIVCLDAQGKERWRVPGKNGASPVIADLDGDGRNEILGGDDNAVIAVDGAGKLRWRAETRKAIDSSIAVADANEDGVVDILAIDLSGTVYCLAPDGTVQWTADVRERVRRSPGIADVDGDGALDIVVAGYSGEMYLFGGNGELNETVPMPNSTNAAPTIADFSGDGTPSVVYATATAGVLAYRWPEAKPGSRVVWAEYRYNSQRVGKSVPATAQSPVRIAAMDFGDLYVGDNTARADIDNPDGSLVRVAFQVDRTGQKPLTGVQEFTDKQVRAEFAYNLGMDGPMAVTVACHVYVGDALVAQRVRDAYVVPFQKELNDLRTGIEALGQAMAGAVEPSFALRGELGSLRERLPDYRGRADAAGTLSDVERRALRDALRADAFRLRRLTRLWQQAAAAESWAHGQWPVQLVAANPWAPFGGMDEVLEGRLGDGAVRVSAFHGETENAAFNAFNFSEAARTVRVEIEDLTRDGETAGIPWHEVITLHEVTAVPTQTLDYSSDALPRMNQGQVLTLPGSEARQVWLAVNTAKLEPGQWKATIHLRTLEVASVSFDIPLEIEVWKVAQADTSVLRHCNWGYVSGSRLKHHEAESIADRVAHGNNVFVSTFVPRADYDAEGNLTGEIKYAAHDEFVRKYAPHGMILFHNHRPIRTPADPESEAYKKAYIHYVRAWVAHLKELGVGYDGFAMYPIDEPGLNDGLVEAYLHNAKLTRAADPQVLMYTDPVERITEEELREMVPYVDIWCPNRDGLLLKVSAEKRKIILEDEGAALWTYECRGNAKHQSPLGYYRAQAWLAWHHGLTGIGFWSYCTSSADPWYRPQDTLDYLMTYQGDGVVASKRWEAVRDGVEDFAMLYALREAAGQGEVGDDAWKSRVASLLGAEASAIGAFCGLDEAGTEPGKGGQPALRELADRRFAEIQRFRSEMEKILSVIGDK